MAKQPHPHKSTTHAERYVHFRNVKSDKFSAVTVFARKEGNGIWYYTLSYCVKQDMFSRCMGRKIARRAYFAQPHKRVAGTDTFDFEVLRLYVEGAIGHFSE